MMEENQVVRDGPTIFTTAVSNIEESSDPNTPLMRVGEVRIGGKTVMVYWSDLTERWSTL